MRLWVLAVCLFVTCTSREPTNPFDPRNPSTGGRPLRLWAIPADTYVRLHWMVPPATDLEAPRLLRMERERIDTVCTGLPLSGTYVDPAASSQSLGYILEVGVQGWVGTHRSDTSVVVASHGSCWLASGYDRISILSPATQTLLPAVSAGSFLVDVSPSHGGLWAAGMPGGIIERIEMDAQGPVLREDATTSLALRSIATAQSTGWVLLAHAEGLAWFDPTHRRLTSWAANLPAPPRMVRLAPDEPGAWVWCTDGIVAYLAPGNVEPLVAVGHADVRDIAPVAGRCCWIGTSGGLFMVSRDGSRYIYPEPILALAAPSAMECWVCLANGLIVLVTVDGDVIGSRELEGYLVCWSEQARSLWVASREALLWKLTPDLQVAARLHLSELPWALTPGD